MLTLGGLLLGAVLTVPGPANAAAPTDPFDSSIPRVTIAKGDRALGLRDPFAIDPHLDHDRTRHRVPRPSEIHADLRDPFLARPAGSSTAPREAARVPTISPAAADLRSPFEAAPIVGPRPGPHPDRSPPELRDPFGR